MLLENYYSEHADGIHFSRQQASSFAKDMAGDFNPIHDHDAKRFCVPGDLLFSLVLNKYGLSQNMRFVFQGMVSEESTIILPDTNGDEFSISDSRGKDYLSVARHGERTLDPQTIANLTSAYVAFSGQTFPHILVPLMANHQVMINPDRPLVIYESMVIQLDRLDFTKPSLELSQATLAVDGKRGDAQLKFQLLCNGNVVGSGEKNMVLSGLREYDEEKLQQLVDLYNSRKNSYTS
ncbi:MAG: DUF3581 domain-containing protein [Gammaproteobacteria bacterium]|nr:DUF3581 domain-containing protein [Gammaproteobacteria bacterium]